VARPRRFRPLELVRRHNWSIGATAGAAAIAALVAGSAYGNLHSSASLQSKIIAWASAGALLAFGVVASSRISAALSHLIVERGAAGAGGAVRVVSAGVGYLFVLFSFLAVLEVSVEKILVGAGLAGVVLGIAAQQSLGNVFAGLVLLVARPFKVGDHIRVRAGALGGIFDAWVWEMSLTYVTLHTDDGLLKIPNSAMLAAGIGQLPPHDPPGGVAAVAVKQAATRSRRRRPRSGASGAGGSGARPVPGALGEGTAELEQ
jgi:small-conductance mechanosensitive channel